jgi:phage gpG-like protein
MSLEVNNDTLSPALRAMARQFADRRPILRVMGQALVGITKRAFNDPTLRPSAWAPPADSTVAAKGRKNAQLKLSGAMWQSIRIADLSSEKVTVGTDRPYAAWQQFGTKPYIIRPKSKKALAWPGAAHPVGVVHHPGLPPRPFFPFAESGQIVPLALRLIESAAADKIKAMRRAAGG